MPVVRAGHEPCRKSALVYRKPLCRGPREWRRISAATRLPASESVRAEPADVDVRLLPLNQIGDDAAGAAGHGPAHMALAGVEPKVLVARAADDRRAVRRHRSQAGPVAR